jgi:ribose transport system permease protein
MEADEGWCEKERMKKLKQFVYYNDLAGILIALAILIVAVSATSPGFLTPFNMTSNLQSISIFFVVGLAQMSVLSLGHFNLAVGAMGCLSSVMMGFFMQEMGMPALVALPLGVLIAGGLGMVQGVLVAKSGINPFIITLALLSFYTGLAAILCQGVPYTAMAPGFYALSEIQLGFVPFIFVISVIIGVVIFFLFRFLKTGRRLLVCGANPLAAVYSGVNLDNTIIIGHTLSGLLCGLAGILQMVRFGAALLSIGNDWMMNSFMAAVLGGTLLSGGKISVVGTFIGAGLAMIINNALINWGVSSYSISVFLGGILILAYIIDRSRKARISNFVSIGDAESNAEAKGVGE